MTAVSPNSWLNELFSVFWDRSKTKLFIVCVCFCDKANKPAHQCYIITPLCWCGIKPVIYQNRWQLHCYDPCCLSCPAPQPCYDHLLPSIKPLVLAVFLNSEEQEGPKSSHPKYRAHSHHDLTWSSDLFCLEQSRQYNSKMSNWPRYIVKLFTAERQSMEEKGGILESKSNKDV